MKSPAFQWYPKDILSSTRVAMMSLQEEGAYRRALDFCWLHGSIPADMKLLCKMIGKGCSSKIARVVADMFTPMPGDNTKLIHERLEKERTKQSEYSKARTKAANKRWETEKEGEKEIAKTDAYASAMHIQKQSKTDAELVQTPYKTDALPLQSAATILNQHHQHTHNDFSKKLLNGEGSLERNSLEISTKTIITEPLLQQFCAHLALQQKQHSTFGEFNAHLRNWINTKPNFQEKTAFKNQTYGNNNPPKHQPKHGRINTSALNQFVNHQSDGGA